MIVTVTIGHHDFGFIFLLCFMKQVHQHKNNKILGLAVVILVKANLVQVNFDMI